MSIIDPHSAAAVVSLVNSTISSVKSVKEMAKQSKDSGLKDQISDVYDAILDLKDKVLALDEENRQLREQLEQQKTVKYDLTFGYYFREDDPVPLCPKCYEDKQGVRHLSQPENVLGGIRRTCLNCTFEKWEQPRKPVQAR
jgi:hypothetical protein